MRYLITGGAGFIGSHLSRRLLADGHSVVVLDDLSTGRRENVVDLVDRPDFQFVVDTVGNDVTVQQLAGACDAVFHLASAVGVQLIVDNPVGTIETIVRGTEVVLNVARKFNLPTLITSSSEVYGKGTKVPFSEDDDVVMGPTRHTRWCYAYAKGIDEFLGLAYHKQFGLPVTIVRLFNTVGPGQVGQYGMVLPRFVEAALAGRPLRVYGDGTQTRCFCHVADVCEALIRLMADSATRGEVYNLGSPDEISISDLAKRVLERTGSKSPIEHVPYEVAYGQRFDDLPRRVPDLDKIASAVGWRPTRDLGRIIDDVIAFVRTRDASAT